MIDDCFFVSLFLDALHEPTFQTVCQILVGCLSNFSLRKGHWLMCWFGSRVGWDSKGKVTIPFIREIPNI